MKNKCIHLILLIIFFSMLLFPSQVFYGAKSGLLLWFLTVLPALFPFLLMSRLLLVSNTCSFLSHLVSPVMRSLFKVSENGSFAIITGFLCGYPIGAKITADLLRSRQISYSEASYLLSFCNNTSPVFLISYILSGTLKKSDLILPSVLILYGTPLLLSFLFRMRKNLSEISDFSTHPTAITCCTGSIDSCISDSCEAIVKIGGYIILFSVLLTLTQLIPVKNIFYQILFLPSLELTNGISMLSASPLSFSALYCLCMGHAAFGGWCAIFQTGSMIRNSGLSFHCYIAKKLITALVTSLIAYLYISL